MCFFIDDFTRFSWIYFLHTNDKVAKMFPLFKAQVENLLNTIIKAIRTDDDIEYNMLNTLFSQINHQATCPYTSQQNNISEKNIDMSLNSL
jgi:replication initiation and membrane attachment protein DnaB